MRELSNEEYDEIKTKIEKMRNDLTAGWNTYIAENLGLELEMNALTDWQKNDLMEIMRKKEAIQRKCYTMILEALDIMDADLL